MEGSRQKCDGFHMAGNGPSTTWEDLFASGGWMLLLCKSTLINLVNVKPGFWVDQWCRYGYLWFCTLEVGPYRFIIELDWLIWTNLDEILGLILIYIYNFISNNFIFILIYNWQPILSNRNSKRHGSFTVVIDNVNCYSEIIYLFLS